MKKLKLGKKKPKTQIVTKLKKKPQKLKLRQNLNYDKSILMKEKKKTLKGSLRRNILTP